MLHNDSYLIHFKLLNGIFNQDSVQIGMGVCLFIKP